VLEEKFGMPQVRLVSRAAPYRFSMSAIERGACRRLEARVKKKPHTQQCLPTTSAPSAFHGLDNARTAYALEHANTEASIVQHEPCTVCTPAETPEFSSLAPNPEPRNPNPAPR
jgi:hypothetical protein